MVFQRSLTNIQTSRLTADYERGMERQLIARKYGVSVSTVYRIIKRVQNDEPLKNEKHPCGTPAAYRRHTRNYEVPCEPCLEAWADYNKPINARYRERKRNEAGSPDLAR